MTCPIFTVSWLSIGRWQEGSYDVPSVENRLTCASQGDGGEESVEVFGDSTAEFRPVVQLPEKQRVNGEEDESVAFSGGFLDGGGPVQGKETMPTRDCYQSALVVSPRPSEYFSLCVCTAADSTLFEFDSTSSKWRERGKGEFKLNLDKSGQVCVRF